MIGSRNVQRSFGSVDLHVSPSVGLVRLVPSASADFKLRRNRVWAFHSLDEVQAGLSHQLGRERRGLPFAADAVRALRVVLKEFPHVF